MAIGTIVLLATLAASAQEGAGKAEWEALQKEEHAELSAKR